jgi:hypothetical protein
MTSIIQVKGTITLTLHLHDGCKKTSLRMGWLAPTIVLKIVIDHMKKKLFKILLRLNNPIMDDLWYNCYPSHQKTPWIF